MVYVMRTAMRIDEGAARMSYLIKSTGVFPHVSHLRVSLATYRIAKYIYNGEGWDCTGHTFRNLLLPKFFNSFSARELMKDRVPLFYSVIPPFRKVIYICDPYVKKSTSLALFI